jgi:hypothetical protein
LIKKSALKSIDLNKLTIYKEEQVTNDLFDENNFAVLKWIVFNVTNQIGEIKNNFNN